MFRIFMFLIAAVLLTGGTLMMRASAETMDGKGKPHVEQTDDLPDSVKPKRKLYA